MGALTRYTNGPLHMSMAIDQSLDFDTLVGGHVARTGTRADVFASIES